VGAFGGRKEIMSMISPVGPVYQAGTLSGNPLAMTAGIETIKELSRPGIYKSIEAKSAMLEKGLKDAAKKANVSTRFYRAGSMFCTYFTDVDVTDYATAKKADAQKFSRFFSDMLEQGVNLAPSQFEAGFMSLAHSEKDIEATVKAAYESLKKLHK
jgi:glutamate-1-semialdehyde 2,1-aminomutase